MKKREFGRIGGKAVEEIILESAAASVSILSLGCVVRDWRVDGVGRSLPVVLGFPAIGDYVQHSKSHGVIAGRVANRTAGGIFDLEGRSYSLSLNEGPNHLHGGVTGLQRRIWDMDRDSSTESVTLTYSSPDGEDGYPGLVDFLVTYRLEGPALICEMRGLPDQPTPINLAQHNYYNLGGGGDVLDHILWVDAGDYTPVGADMIPDGRIAPVDGMHFDFREAVAIGSADPDRLGIDHNLVLRPDRDTGKAAATAYCPRTGLRLSVFTEEPGLQLFNAAAANVPVAGHDNTTYGAFSGLCLEAQHFPDSLHNSDWPSIIQSPENPYFQQLKVEIKND